MSRELSDGVIRLRAPRGEDAEAAVTAVRSSCADLMAWTSWCHADYSQADFQQFLRKVEAERFEDRAYDFYIFEGTESRILGGCGVYHIDRAAASGSLGYWVRSDATGKGIATRAARLLVHFAVNDLDLLRLEIIVAVGNSASQRVAEKIGAVREGVARNRLRVRGQPTDAVMYSFIPADLSAQPAGDGGRR